MVPDMLFRTVIMIILRLEKLTESKPTSSHHCYANFQFWYSRSLDMFHSEPYYLRNSMYHLGHHQSWTPLANEERSSSKKKKLHPIKICHFSFFILLFQHKNDINYMENKLVGWYMRLRYLRCLFFININFTNKN